MGGLPYNTEHHHSGLAGFTPEQVFTGQYYKIAQAEQLTLDPGYQKYQERFVKGHPIEPMAPKTEAINPITPSSDGEYVDDRLNFPTLKAAGYVKQMISFN